MILSFCGLAKSGKTTASDHLVNTKGYKKINFKDALVDEMRRNFPRTMEAMIKLLEKDSYDGNTALTIDVLFETKPDVFRAFMQEYGTEVRRGDKPSYWTDQWKDKVREALRHGYNVVTDDCRFLNEEQAIRDLGGNIIRIVRTDITDTDNHQSEVEQKLIKDDTTITVAKGEHQELYDMLNDWITEYGR